MSISRKLSELSGSADGRGRLATLASILVLASLLVLVMAVLPAGAGSGKETTTHNVQPAEVSYGGGSGACFAAIPGRLPSAAKHELHINNPATGTYTGPDGTRVRITVDAKDGYFDFTFINNPAMAAFDVVVNGGSQNTHFDYDDHLGPGGEPYPGPQRADTDLHAPTKGGSSNLYNLSHINICYDLNPLADLSVTKTPVGGGTASEGDVVEFEIVVSNADVPVSNTTATGVMVTDDIPLGMTFASAAPGGSLSADGRTYTWSGLVLPPGTSQTLKIRLTIDADTGGQDLVNSVSVTGDQADPNPGDESFDSDPPVTVNANLSGTVFVDANANSAYDSGEAPEALIVRVYNSIGLLVDSTISSADDGSYSFALAPDTTYTVCLDKRESHQQTIPDLDTNPPAVPGVHCDESVNEPVGYSVPLAANVSGKDFGNLPLFPCDVELSTTGLNISAAFEIFANETYPICGEKGGSLTTILVDGIETVAFVLDGSGSTAARGEITKTSAGPDFVPLTYSPGEDGTFVVLPWCNVRDTGLNDGPQFDLDLGNTGIDDKYPSLDGVYDDPGNTIPSISCKVTEFEDILGNQITVVFGEFLDPWYR